MGATFNTALVRQDWGTAIEQANAAYEVQRAFVQSLARHVAVDPACSRVF